MRKQRFFLNQNLAVNQEFSLDKDFSHHISRVLRMQAGDLIFLFNNSGHEFTAQVVTVERNAVHIKVVDQTTPIVESSLSIHLGQVIGKGEKMDVVIQKATELGVQNITPLYSQHSVVKQVEERLDNKLEHWQRIATSASAQSWRTNVPQIQAPQTLNAWITSNTAAHKLILHPDQNAHKIHNLQISDNVAILIGPEGGFSDSEIALAQANNFQTISLGPRILRTETAGVATIAILQALFGDI